MKLVLHPGHSKCGSTTIQKAIIKNRNLLESVGYVIPDPQMRTKGDYGFNPNGETPRPYFRHVMENGDIASLQSKLDSITKKYKYDDNAILLVSAENLVNQLGKESGAGIHKALASYFSDVQVLYYIRRQDDFLMSAWQQWGYKQGITLDHFAKKAVQRRNPNYLISMEKFEKLYGVENVTVIPLLKDYLLNGSLLSDFFYRLSVTGFEKNIQAGVENKSLNPFLCEALSKETQLFRDVHDERVKNNLSRVLGEGSGLFYNTPSYLSPSLRKYILNAFSQDNKMISSRFFNGQPWSEVSFNETDHDREELMKASRLATRVMTKLYAYNSFK
ncbi:hypothetical protein [Halomonas halmophila]|uniref:Sulfotransferase domain-containing protein n=1 Tax=Halomonas halmophila TaxID=252 RepID=A0A4Y4F247_9GAMM|nr:hypothetical protein [Halomonas halmophila]GED23426.1 hypothetical protein HHA01_24030 [Halomonas halmophila]